MCLCILDACAWMHVMLPKCTWNLSKSFHRKSVSTSSSNSNMHEMLPVRVATTFTTPQSRSFSTDMFTVHSSDVESFPTQLVFSTRWILNFFFHSRAGMEIVFESFVCFFALTLMIPTYFFAFLCFFPECAQQSSPTSPPSLQLCCLQCIQSTLKL